MKEARGRSFTAGRRSSGPVRPTGEARSSFARESAPRPKRALGQNFLQDANIAGKIVRALEIQPADSILEIGPGAGALTGIVLEQTPARLVLVEKDRHWAGERMRAGEGKVSVVLADALLFPWERFHKPWKFLGNLPYNVASPLIWNLLSLASGLTKAVFMVQKEVGVRLAAGPGEDAYGALSVWVQSFSRPRLEFFVPPQVFFPRPKVDSAVLSFVPARGGIETFSPSALARTLHACFQKRRKQLGTTVRAAGGDTRQLEALDIDPGLRPGALTVEAFHLLSLSGIF